MDIRSLIGKGSPGMRCLEASRARNFMPNLAETALFQGMVQNPIPYKGKVFTKGSLYGVPVATNPMRLYGESRNAGDASATVQMQVIKMILDKSQELPSSDRAVLLAMARFESGFNPDAASANSSAAGVFQLISKTGDFYGLDKSSVFDAELNIDAGISLFEDNVYKQQTRQLFSGLDLYARGELAYALHHDGPSLAYGGKELAAEGITPFLKDYLAVVNRYDQICEVG